MVCCFGFFSDGSLLTVFPSNVVTVNQLVKFQCEPFPRSVNTMLFHIQLNSSPICTLEMIYSNWNCKLAENSCISLYNVLYNVFCNDELYSIEVTVTMHWKGAVVFCQDDSGQSNRIFIIMEGAVMLEFLHEILILHFMSLLSKNMHIFYELISDLCQITILTFYFNRDITLLMVNVWHTFKIL